MALHAGELLPAIVAGDDLQVVELVGVHCAGAQSANLALANEVVQGLHGLFHGHVVVEAVDDVEVQVVGAQALERSLDLTLDGRGGEAALVEVDLTGDHDVLASDAQIAQGGADVLLARAEAVAVGGVDEVDAGVEGALDDGAGVVRADGPLVEIGAGLAEAHAAETELGDLDAGVSEGGVAHGAAFPLCISV